MSFSEVVGSVSSDPLLKQILLGLVTNAVGYVAGVVGGFAFSAKTGVELKREIRPRVALVSALTSLANVYVSPIPIASFIGGIVTGMAIEPYSRGES